MKDKIKAEDFKALSDPTRHKILELLSSKKGYLCVCVIAEKMGITQPAVSQHLKILKNVNLVKATRKGYYVHYTVNPEKLNEFRKEIDKMHKRAVACCTILDSSKCCPDTKKKRKKRK